VIAARTSTGVRIVLAVLLALTALVLVAPSARADPLAEGSIKVTVLNMTPTTPVYSSTPQPLTFTLSLQNTTDQTIGRIELDADRDSPITSPSRLSSLIAAPVAADPSLQEELNPYQLPSLAAHKTVAVLYKTTTSSVIINGNICLCLQGIYPIDFTVRAATDPNGSLTEVGFAQTYLPSFQAKPAPVQVSWVWPLIDRPHRLKSQTIFTDDDLFGSISAGGRLDRALTVAEQVAGHAQVTLVIDPELIDELTVMTTGYQVEKATGEPVAGTGGSAARAFLARLKALAPKVDVNLTAYADPDVDALSAQQLTWPATTAKPAQVEAALGPDTHSDFVWPADAAITNNALSQVVADGARSVLLGASMFGGTSGELDALAPLPLDSGVNAVVVDNTLQSLAGGIVTEGGLGTQQLPVLVSDLAVRAAADPAHKHYVALAAPRYVNANVGVATRAILETATASWAAPMSVHEALSGVTPVSHGSLTPLATSSSAGLSPSLVGALSATTHFITTFTSALAQPDEAGQVQGDLPWTLLWGSSNAWRQNQAGGDAFTTFLNQSVAAFRAGVHIARPSNGNYTLASSNAPLPITVINTLPFAMKINITLVPVNGAAGFEADPVVGMTVPAHSQTPVRVGVHVQRAGRFQILASVTTADGTDLGEPVPLSVHSTALGTVGVIITAASGGVLVLLLLLRIARRIRRGPTKPKRGAAFAAPEAGAIGA
jgi:Family of unknown function (DUF6049)